MTKRQIEWSEKYYDLNTMDSRIVIKKENLPRAYELLCELNAHDELKTGGCWLQNKEKPAESKSVAKNPNVWFAWTPWNYDEICKSAVEILERLDFRVVYDNHGNLLALFLDDEAGDQGIFLNALAPVVEDGSYIVLMGDGDYRNIFRCLFKDGKMYEQKATVETSWPELKE